MGITETGLLAIVAILITIGLFMVTGQWQQYVGAFLIITGLCLLWYYVRETGRKRLEFVIRHKSASVDAARNWKWGIALYVKNASFLRAITLHSPVLRIQRGAMHMDKATTEVFQPLRLEARHSAEIDLHFVSAGGLDGDSGEWEHTSLRIVGDDKHYEIPVGRYEVA